MKLRQMRYHVLSVLTGCMFLLSGCGNLADQEIPWLDSEPIDYLESSTYSYEESVVTNGSDVYVNGYSIPDYVTDGPISIEVNGNVPFFTEDEQQRTDAFEVYSPLDDLGRCGVAYANICKELQPTEARGDIGFVKPSGWHTVKYNDLISGNYLYNRCHLIGFQLAGENANELNLITGTRALNVDGMLSYENLVDDYVDQCDNHVLYRVTPFYSGEDLVARGVLMEGYSVEDAGTGVCFCVFVYNIQPGITIDYATGDSWRTDGTYVSGDTSGEEQDFVLNTSSGKFHRPDCQYAESMSESNRLELHQTLEAMYQAGYEPCKSCHPEE